MFTPSGILRPCSTSPQRSKLDRHAVTSLCWSILMRDDRSAEHLRSRGLPPLVSSSESVQLHIEEQLSTCSSDTYILVSQPGVNAADFKTASAAPHLRRYMTGGEGEDSRSPTASFHVPDVLGHFDLVWAESYLERTCGAEIMNVDASSKSSSCRHRACRQYRGVFQQC